MVRRAQSSCAPNNIDMTGHYQIYGLNCMELNKNKWNFILTAKIFMIFLDSMIQARNISV